jgi:ribosomal protein S18 acetylase RimI-like enzyme
MKNNGYRYYAAYFDDNKAGYFAIKPDKPSGLFLSKLYVEKRFRGKGIARVMLNKIINICENEGYDNIWLTVNKNNVKSIAVYKKMGFEISEALVTDIGGGFVMDDFKMVLKV